MHEQSLDLLSDPQFQKDFVGLYKYYKDTHFQRFYTNRRLSSLLAMMVR